MVRHECHVDEVTTRDSPRANTPRQAQERVAANHCTVCRPHPAPSQQSLGHAKLSKENKGGGQGVTVATAALLAPNLLLPSVRGWGKAEVQNKGPKGQGTYTEDPRPTASTLEEDQSTKFK